MRRSTRLLLLGLIGSLTACRTQVKGSRSSSIPEKYQSVYHLPTLRAGVTLNDITGSNSLGAPVHISLANRTHSSLLFVSSPHCPFCRINFHNWRTLKSGVSNDQIVWLDTTGTVDALYLKSYGISSDSRVLASSDFSSQLGIDPLPTPTTILVSPRGVVLWIGSGVLSDEQVKSLGLAMRT